MLVGLTENKASTVLTDDEEQLVASELIRLLVARLFFSSCTSVIGYGALAILLKDVVAPRPLLTWFSLLFLSEATNCVLEWKLKRGLNDREYTRRWLGPLTPTVFVTGLLWGMAVDLPGLQAAPGVYVVTLLFLAVVAIFSVHNLCFSRRILTAFTVGLALPTMASLLRDPTAQQSMLAISAIVFLFMLQFYGQATRKLYENDIRSHVLTKRLASELQRSNEDLRTALERVDELARLDPMTQCLNRRAVMEILAGEWERTVRYGNTFGVIMVDADHFKSINDTHGHGIGDAVLIAMTTLIRGKLRACDSLARWGGEEFLCILVNVDQEMLMKKAQQLCDALAASPLITHPVSLRVTASFGTAICATGDLVEGVIERADQALYRAKKAGRNQVCG